MPDLAQIIRMHYSQLPVQSKNGEALKLAEELAVPYLDDLYECMNRNFDEYYYECAYLMDSPESFPAVQEALNVETDEDRLKTLTLLLKGETDFQKKDCTDTETENSEENTDE